MAPRKTTKTPGTSAIKQHGRATKAEVMNAPLPTTTPTLSEQAAMIGKKETQPTTSEKIVIPDRHVVTVEHFKRWQTMKAFMELVPIDRFVALSTGGLTQMKWFVVYRITYKTNPQTGEETCEDRIIFNR